MKRATALAFALALAAGVYLVWRGGWPIVAIGVCSILFGIMYTGGPYPLGYHGWADLFVLVFFGPVAVAGTYYVQALQFDWQPVIAGIAPGLFSVAILTVNNLRDIDTDRTAGKKTLPARFGRTFARIEYVICVVVGSAAPLFLRLAFDSPRWSLLTLVVPVLAVPAIHDVFTKSGRVLNSTLATTGQLLLIYSILFSVGWLL
jgi:1,4-dihydroxy-2-naphthoate octaprenyltransferase